MFRRGAICLYFVLTVYILQFMSLPHKDVDDCIFYSFNIVGILRKKTCCIITLVIQNLENESEQTHVESVFSFMKNVWTTP